ncbi:uncharacterized protein METZ01_LOCUS207861, partial [marine metagenome]
VDLSGDPTMGASDFGQAWFDSPPKTDTAR